jgi:hypothetical protein
MPARAATAALVVQYLQAQSNERRLLEQAMPRLFTADFLAAAAEADAMLAEADASASDALDAVVAVGNEVGINADGVAIPVRTQSRELFLATLAQLILEQLNDDGDEEEAEGDDADYVAMTTTDKLFTVLPTVAEFSGVEGAVTLEGTCRLFRACLTEGREHRSMWFGIAMRQFPALVTSHIAAVGPDAVLSADWRTLVRRWVRSQPTC